MRDKKRLLLVLVVLLGIVAVAHARSQKQIKTDTQSTSRVLTSYASESSHPMVFFDEEKFYTGVEQANSENNVNARRIAGGLIPHHLYPGFIIADFFHRLTVQKPKSIILIGPNHYERGDHKALASVSSWETPFGLVEPNGQMIQELVQRKQITIDEAVLPKDHAVAGIMPFMKYYLPDTRVVPILLSGFMTEQEIQALAKHLTKQLDKDTILIAAVDFSHYLTSTQAKEKDSTTFALMQGFQYRQLLSLSNEYLDSAPSVIALLLTMKNLGTTKTEVLYHTNSGELQKNNSIETTSYFSLIYY